MPRLWPIITVTPSTQFRMAKAAEESEATFDEVSPVSHHRSNGHVSVSMECKVATLMTVIDLLEVAFRAEVILFNVRKAASGHLPVTRSGKTPRCFVICLNWVPRVIPPLSARSQTRP